MNNRPFRLCDKLLAIARKDFLTGIRYRLRFSDDRAGRRCRTGGVLYLSRAIGPSSALRVSDVSFLLVGAGFYAFLMMGINSFLTSMQESQQSGTLEVLMTSRTSPATLIFLSAASAFSRNALRLLLYLAAGLMLLSSVHLRYKMYWPPPSPSFSLL